MKQVIKLLKTDLSKNNHYYPQLDAIRGLFFLTVFAGHSCHPVFGTGTLSQLCRFFWDRIFYGIDGFFVLSAFLLTWLGLNEWDKKDSFSFRNYFVRRSLRIWPLYFIILFFAFCVLPLIANYLHVKVTLPKPEWYVFFISNFYEKDHVYFLRFLWTISAEEQFYLLLAVCLVFFHKRLLAIAFILLLISIIFNFFGMLKDWDLYFNTLTYVYNFGIGMLVALFVKRENGVFKKIIGLSPRQIIITYTLLPTIMIIIFLLESYTSLLSWKFGMLYSRLIFILFVGFAIIEQLFNKNTPFNFGRSRFLIFTGRRSYGLYCFHGIVLTFGGIILDKLNFDAPEIIRALPLLAGTYIMASLSYSYLELPFLRLKGKFKR